MVGAMRLAVFFVAAGLTAAMALAGCSSDKNRYSGDPFAGKGSPHYKGSGPLPKGGGRYHVGKPYQVAGRWFKPQEDPGYDKTGLASWYGDAFHRRMTSNGEWFDMNEMTAAHPTLPLPSYAKVTNLENGRSIVVRINDRGPFVGTRIIDLSKHSAETLAFARRGTVKVRVQYIGPAPLDDDGGHLLAMNRELEQGTPLRRMIAAAGSGGDGGGRTLAAAHPPVPGPVETEEQPAPASANGYDMAGAYYVQVGSFANASNAERTRSVLANTWPVEVAQVDGGGQTIYRVRLGPIDSAEDASAALESAVAAGHPDAHIVNVQPAGASL